MTEHEVLVKTRNLLDRAKWGQGKGTTTPQGGRHCILTALSCFSDEADVSGRLTEAAGIKPYTLARWNDAPGRTKQDVLDLLDRAIAETAPAPHDPLSGQVPMVGDRRIAA